MTLPVVRVQGPRERLNAFDGRNATLHDLQYCASRDPGAAVLVEAPDEDRGVKVVTADCAAKNMETDTSREPKDGRRLGRDFDTNMPHREDDVWDYVFGRLER